MTGAHDAVPEVAMRGSYWRWAGWGAVVPLLYAAVMVPSSGVDLVPDYLAAVPGTGMPAFPNFRISNSAKRMLDPAAEGWELSVSWGEPGFHDHDFFCWPSQTYAEHGRRNTPVRRTGAWAYVHFLD